jgi:hypothetical protein
MFLLKCFFLLLTFLIFLKLYVIKIIIEFKNNLLLNRIGKKVQGRILDIKITKKYSDYVLYSIDVEYQVNNQKYFSNLKASNSELNLKLNEVSLIYNPINPSIVALNPIRFIDFIIKFILILVLSVIYIIIILFPQFLKNNSDNIYP